MIDFQMYVAWTATTRFNEKVASAFPDLFNHTRAPFSGTFDLWTYVHLC